MKPLDLAAIRARAAGTVTSPLRQGRRDTPANEDAIALLAHIEGLEADRTMLLHREVLLKRAHGALADAGCVVPIEPDKGIEHAIHALAERALTAEERLEQMARERDKEREEWASRRCECSASDSCKMARERDEALAEVKTWKHDWYVAKADLGTAMRLADVALRDVAEKYKRALRERDEAVHACAAALAERITWYQRGREEALKKP